MLTHTGIKCNMEETLRKKNSTEIFLLPIVFLWMGLVIGISFIEAPLKFQAPDVTIKIGIGIGRLVFAALNKAEIMFAVLSILPTIYFYKKTKIGGFCMVFTYTVLAIQTLYLLPALNANVERILNNKPIATNSFHLFYIVCEVVKLVLLFSVGTLVVKQILDEKRH